jgi:hypothetical protein
LLRGCPPSDFDLERFLNIRLPEEFVLEVETKDGRWIDWGLFRRDLFQRLEDGTYVCAGHGWSPLFLRCLEQRGDLIDVVDGTGKRFTYRLVPFPSDRYQRID